MTIIEFCDKWKNSFENFNIHIFEEEFGQDCEKLGFVMDCGNSFKEKYHTVPFNPESLQVAISDVNDLKLLGSLVFSYWRYLTHWSMGFDTKEVVKWFDIAFTRMCELDNIPWC